MMKRGAGWAGMLILAMSVTASAQGSVRSSHSGLTALIARATSQSQTFKALSNAVNASDGIVYIEPGICGHGVAACLTHVTAGGGNRILWVRVGALKNETDLIASIGHELRHALEVLGEPAITSNAAMHLFYLRRGLDRRSGAFETAAAVEAGRMVRAEIQKGRR